MNYSCPVTLPVDMPPYADGTEPVPVAIPGDGTPLLVYNFSDELLQAGQGVTFVLDMFQRWVYSKNTGHSVIVEAQQGRIEEPVLSSPYRNYSPNFTGTDVHGNLTDIAQRINDPFYAHHLSSGLFRLFHKKYPPIQATYQGSELYVDMNGTLKFRERGELRFTPDGKPLYLLRRRSRRDARFFALHHDFFAKKNPKGRNVYFEQLRSDSPLQMEYADGRACHFDIKPIPLVGLFPEEWELTLDYSQAQPSYDLCLAPDAADSECFVKGEELCFRRKTAFTKVPVFVHGVPLEKPIYSDDGILLQENWQWAGYTYYEVIPEAQYREPLRGQGVTDALYFRELSDHLQFTEISQAGESGVIEYVRLQLVPEMGVPALYGEERVCRLCAFTPSRGVFYKIDEEGTRYPVLTTPDTSEGYGIPTAVLHHAYNEQTHECTDVVDHPGRRLVREGHELLLDAEEECWQQCGHIDGTIPPDLGDPRLRSRHIIFIEHNQNVIGELPP